MSFSLRYAHANVLVGPGDQSAGLFRLGMTSYPYLPNGEKWALQRRLQRLASTVATDFSLWRVNRAYPAERYVQHTAGLLDVRHQDPAVWSAFLEGHRERLARLGAHIPECYMAVSLASGQTTGMGGSLVRGVDRARRRVEDLAGVGAVAPISARDLEDLCSRELRLLERIRGVIPARPARTMELQWLLRRAACRGLGEPELDRHWQPDALVVEGSDGAGFEPLRHDLARCANAAITERHQTLIVEGEEGRSFQAMLAVGALADCPEFPGSGAEVLFAPLEAVGFPVDAVLHARWVGNRQALAAVRKRISDVEHAYREQIEGAAHGPSLLAGEDRVLAREYEALLASGGHPPMLYAYIGLAVGATDEEELERRVATLKERYGDIALHRPVGLQRELFFGHLPGTDGWA
ncbi:MAG TPA: hypothetical protein VK701_00475 [Solirubrobacteraceae bacterium]|nr:hypothetical protein [Solirubrobacteraceae bacterium]